MLPAVLSHAWASWKSAPGVALLAIVAFAVGIGSATAIFTVINGVMLRPLPYPEGERFVALYGANVTEPGRYSSSTFPDLITYQQRTTSFDVNAGHNAPYLVRAGRCGPADGGPAPAGIEELSTGGSVIGMFPETDYDEATVDLHPGDVLLAFTDGVPEAQNPDNVEFGEERLKQLLCETVHMPADAISARISAGLKDWIRDAEQYDDLTFIVMKMR